jgi:hypothetical protein
VAGCARERLRSSGAVGVRDVDLLEVGEGDLRSVGGERRPVSVLAGPLPAAAIVTGVWVEPSALTT